MQQIGPMIAASGSVGLNYAERLLTGVTADQFARLARPGGQVVQSNHPAFVFGHLSLYPPRIFQLLGANNPHGPLSGDYERLFKAGIECVDDPDRRIYPPMAELTERFFASHKSAIQVVAAANDADMVKPNPAEGRMRELFPTIGAVLTFFLSGHIQNHLGQMSAWRRAMGLAPV